MTTDAYAAVDPSPPARARLVGPARLSGRRSQQAFDVILRSVAEPGSIRTPVPSVLTPGVPSALVLALALADVEVGITVDDDPGSPWAALVRDATGAGVVGIESAWIATLLQPTAGLVSRCPTGTALRPEDGCRLALAVDDLVDGPGPVTLTLSGPGVPGERVLGVEGLDPTVIEAVRTANRSFPAGVDTWLVAPDGRMAALARSTTISTRERR